MPGAWRPGPQKAREDHGNEQREQGAEGELLPESRTAGSTAKSAGSAPARRPKASRRRDQKRHFESPIRFDRLEVRK